MAASVLGPGSNESVCDSFESPFWVRLKHETHWLSKLDIWGAYLLGAGLNGWDAHCCDHTPCSSGEALGFEFLPNCGLLCPRWGLWQAYDSPSSALMWVSSHLPDVQTLLNRFLDFFFLPGEIFPFVAVDWVCPLEEVSSWPSFSYLMTQPLSASFEYVIILCP